MKQIMKDVGCKSYEEKRMAEMAANQSAHRSQKQDL